MDHSNGVRTALSIASEQGNFASVCGLLEYASTCDLHDLQNSNVNFADEEGRSPISYAAGNGHFQISNLLLQHGANAHLPDLYGRTPLSWAAGGGHFSTVRLFLSPKYNINANSQDGLGQTPFFWACANGHSQVVAMMLARHDIFYPSDYKGNSPLAAAAANGRESVIKILLTSKKVIQDWVVTSWKEEMAKDAWKSNNPGVWNFRTTIAWDHRVSLLPQNKAMAHGHWDIAKLLRLHWEGLDMKRYPIADNVKAEFKETTTTNNPDLTTYVYDPSGSGSFYPYDPTAGAGEVKMPASDEWGATNNPDLSTHEYGPSRNGSYCPYEQAAGEVGMPAYDESATTNTPDLSIREYDPLRANYPYEQAAGEVGMPANDEYRPLDHGSYYCYPNDQTAAAGGGFEAEVVPAYEDECGPTYAYGQSSASEGPTGEAINYYHDDDNNNNNKNNNDSKDNNKDTTTQTAITKKHHRKRYRKSKAINVHVAKNEETKEEGEEEEEEKKRGAAAEGKF